MIGRKITEFYAWVVEDENGDEGVPAFTIMGNPAVLPMVGSDRDRMESLRPNVMVVADLQQKPVRLMRFYSMEVIDTCIPVKRH